MGGGDLNLKKSWHPSTLRNIERVWKAEQKNEAEKLKIEQLQKELAEERAREEIQTYAEDQGVVKKKDERLDWMYQGPAAMVNREEYLMGRKIDKTLEVLQMKESGKEPPKEDDSQPGAIFCQATASNVTVDIANKIREDPLFAIMKREKEQRKTLLTNPVRMKQLQAILKKSIAKDKKKKKSKKSKKARQSSESSDTSNTSSDDSSHKVKRKEKNYQTYESSYYKTHKSSSKTKSEREISDEHRKSRCESDEEVERSEKRRKRSKEHHKPIYAREYSLSPDVRYKESKKSYNNSHYKQQMYKTHKEYDRKEDNYQRNRKLNRSESKKKLSQEEKEKLREEMMENAKWREEQRVKNVKRYAEEAEKEDKMTRGDTSKFIRPMLSKAAEKGSLEGRIKQKIFTIQRSESDMGRNFARR